MENVLSVIMAASPDALGAHSFAIRAGGTMVKYIFKSIGYTILQTLIAMLGASTGILILLNATFNKTSFNMAFLYSMVVAALAAVAIVIIQKNNI